MIEKRRRGRPVGSLSGSIHRTDNNETPHLITQIRHAPKFAELIELKHPQTGKYAVLTKSVCDAFYDEYFNSNKPVDKELVLEEFGIKYFGLERKLSKTISLYDAVGIAKSKLRK